MTDNKNQNLHKNTREGITDSRNLEIALYYLKRTKSAESLAGCAEKLRQSDIPEDIITSALEQIKSVKDEGVTFSHIRPVSWRVASDN
jgi:hypothetical protein